MGEASGVLDGIVKSSKELQTSLSERRAPPRVRLRIRGRAGHARPDSVSHRLEFQLLLGELDNARDPTPAPGAPAPNDPLNHLALATTDTRGAIEHVRAAGFPVTVEPREVDLNGLRAIIAFFTGPSGESIELFQTLE